MRKQDKEIVLNSFFWKIAERIASQGIGFVISVILARLLMPAEYGVVAMTTVYMVIAQVFVTGGVSMALVQKKDADHLDFNSLMFCSLVMSVVVYVITWFSAPLLASFFNEPQLVDVTRLYAVTLILNSYNSIQQAWVSKHMKFKKFFYSSFSAVCTSGVVGVSMAYLGYGVWALVWSQIVYSATVIIVIKSMIEWHPRLEFSWERAKPLLGFGINLLGSNLFAQIYQQLRQLLIGKYYSAADLALYNRGKHYPELVTNQVDVSFSQVLFPAMSKYGDDPVRVKQMTRRAMQTSSYVMFFLMTTLGICAYPLISLMLTDKWIDCVPYLQMVCFARVLHTIGTANLQAIAAIGRSDMVLKLELIKKPIGIIMIAISVPFGVFWVAGTLPLYSLYSSYVNMRPNKKLIGYKYLEQIRDIMPAIMLSVAMIVVVYPFNLFVSNDWALLILQVVLCCIIYFGGSRLFNVESGEYLVGVIKNIFIRKFNNKA